MSKYCKLRGEGVELEHVGNKNPLIKVLYNPETDPRIINLNCPLYLQCMGTAVIIVGFAVVGPAPYFGVERGHYPAVCVGLSVGEVKLGFVDY